MKENNKSRRVLAVFAHLDDAAFLAGGTLAAAAAARGLPPEKALQAAAQTVAGTAHMVQESGRKPEQLKQMIGLRTLKEDDARKVFTDAYNEAVQKLQAVGQKVAAAAAK